MGLRKRVGVLERAMIAAENERGDDRYDFYVLKQRIEQLERRATQHECEHVWEFSEVEYGVFPINMLFLDGDRDYRIVYKCHRCGRVKKVAAGDVTLETLQGLVALGYTRFQLDIDNRKANKKGKK